MKSKIKTLCTICAGVIGGTIFSAATGEKPCKCNKKQNNKKRFGKFWENGRETHNS